MMEQCKILNIEFKDKIYLLAVQSVAQIFNETVRKKLDFIVQIAEKKEIFESFPNANQGQQIDFFSRKYV